jgi:hypothetical protein
MYKIYTRNFHLQNPYSVSSLFHDVSSSAWKRLYFSYLTSILSNGLCRSLVHTSCSWICLSISFSLGESLDNFPDRANCAVIATKSSRKEFTIYKKNARCVKACLQGAHSTYACILKAHSHSKSGGSI